MSAAPQDSALPERERFTAFLADLIESHVIGFPAYVLTGSHLPSLYTLGTALIPYEWPDSPAPVSLRAAGVDMIIRYAGSDPDALLAAARAAPLGFEDVCVYFISRYYPPSPGLTPQQMAGCEAGVFATITPRALVHDEPFHLMASGWLYGPDPDDPEVPERLRGEVVRSYPVAPSLSEMVHKTRWFLQLDGKSWELMAPALPVCERHFGADHFAGNYLW
jgi:hypothetical protein